jgi:hypothetical protein
MHEDVAGDHRASGGRMLRAIVHERAEIANCYRRSVPATTMSTLRLPHREQTNRERHLGTGVSAPCQRA